MQQNSTTSISSGSSLSVGEQHEKVWGAKVLWKVPTKGNVRNSVSS